MDSKVSGDYGAKKFREIDQMFLPSHLLEKILALVPTRVIVVSGYLYRHNHPVSFLTAHEACLYMIRDYCDRRSACSFDVSVWTIDSTLEHSITLNLPDQTLKHRFDHWRNEAAQQKIAESVPANVLMFQRCFANVILRLADHEDVCIVHQHKWGETVVSGVFSSAERAVKAAVLDCFKDPSYICQLFYPRIGLMNRDWVTEYYLVRNTVAEDGTIKQVTVRTKFNKVLKEYLLDHGYEQLKLQITDWSKSPDEDFLQALTS